jgi:triosephosphate isomerase
MRRGIVAANWKMNLRHTEVKRYLENFLLEVEDVSDAQIVFVPFYTSFPPLAISLESSQKPVELSAQYAQWERNREITAALVRALQLADVGIGQSERSGFRNRPKEQGRVAKTG